MKAVSRVSVFGVVCVWAVAGCGSDGGGSSGTGSLRHQGIGVACDTDGDCAAGQYCHLDTTDYIAHRQCTADCASEADCAEFGEVVMCIGANVCVAECLTNDDCPDMAICNSYGWCERTGPASGNPYCTGTPTACGALSGYTCTGTPGCTDTSACSGVASSCYSQYSSYSCTGQDGCYWSYSTSSCSGSPRSCSLMNFDFECQAQSGCYWSGGCVGTPSITCEEQPASLCDFTDGCRLAFP